MDHHYGGYPKLVSSSAKKKTYTVYVLNTSKHDIMTI